MATYFESYGGRPLYSSGYSFPKYAYIFANPPAPCNIESLTALVISRSALKI